PPNPRASAFSVDDSNSDKSSVTGRISMYQKILVPLDGSTLAEAALPHARALAQCADAEVVLLHIAVDPMREYELADTMVTTKGENGVERFRFENRGSRERAAAVLRADGVSVTTAVQEGAVAETILDFANSAHADLIVMSTHGRSGVARWLLG